MEGTGSREAEKQRSRGARDDVQQVDASKCVCVRRTFLDLNLNYICIYDSSSRESPLSGHVTQPIISILAPTPRYAARFPFSKSSSWPSKRIEAPRAYPVAPLLYQVPSYFHQLALHPSKSPHCGPKPGVHVQAHTSTDSMIH